MVDEVHPASETNPGECCDCAEKIRALEEQVDLLNSQLEAAKRVLLEIKEAVIYWDESENIPSRVDDALAEIEAKQ